LSTLCLHNISVDRPESEQRRAIEHERRAHPPASFVGKPLDWALDDLTRGQAEP
jgi:hypothetical protein